MAMSVFAYAHVFLFSCVFVCQEESQEENSCCLKDLQEGLVGKMLVRKSGKVQLILGNVTLDVALGTPCAFLQVSHTQNNSMSLTVFNSYVSIKDANLTRAQNGNIA